MILFRRKRTFVWLLLLAGLGTFLALGRMDARATGSFEVRPTVRVELRAPVTGFLREVYHDEGEQVYAGRAVALLEVPDLDAQLEQKRAAVHEGAARLALARAGPRPEEVVEQRGRTARLKTWRDLAEQDLTRSRQALQHDLTRLEKEAAEHHAEKEHARELADRLERLVDKQALSRDEIQEAKKRFQVAGARQEQAEAKRRARQALGTQEFEVELARREKELADAQAAQRLLEAAGRPEEIAAEEARLARLREEVRYLEVVRGKLRIFSTVAGIVSTPRLKEKVGQYFREGDLICVVEAPDALEIEVTLNESDVERVQPGQAVELRCRAFPLERLTARVDRIAPRAARTEPPSTAPSTARGEFPNTVVVYCQLEDAHPGLRPGMTGEARICFWSGSVGEVLADRALRFLRSEFWW